jgi:hypothetical protein
MYPKNNQVFFMLILMLGILPMHAVSADTGPKPSMDFLFKQGFSGAPLTIKSGTLYECEQSDCQDAKALRELGPQRFSCTSSGCSALAYGFSTYHRLVINFSDGKIRQSNIFKTTQFQASYQVTVRQEDLLVEPTFSLNLFTPWTYILLCVGCLVGIVILVTLFFLLTRRIAKKK